MFLYLAAHQSQTEKECVLVIAIAAHGSSQPIARIVAWMAKANSRSKTAYLRHAAYWITGVTNSGGLIKITHPVLATSALPGYEDWEHWRDGDNVEIVLVEGTTYPTAPSVNGSWIIHKLNSTSFELVGSTYVADTYKNLTGGEPPGTKGYMKPGPRYHLPLTFGRAPSISGVLQGWPSSETCRSSGLIAERPSPIWAQPGR